MSPCVMHSYRRRIVRSGLCARVLSLVLLVTAIAPLAVQAEPKAFPDVDIMLIAEVQDTTSWLALHQEVLATPPGAGKTLRASLPARTGGGRSLDIEQPRFTVALIASGGKPQVKVTVAGKVNPSVALSLLTPFQQAAMDVQAGAVTNDLTMTYGLAVVAGHLLEVYFDRP